MKKSLIHPQTIDIEVDSSIQVQRKESLENEKDKIDPKAQGKGDGSTKSDDDDKPLELIYNGRPPIMSNDDLLFTYFALLVKKLIDRLITL